MSLSSKSVITAFRYGLLCFLTAQIKMCEKLPYMPSFNKEGGKLSTGCNDQNPAADGNHTLHTHAHKQRKLRVKAGWDTGIM